MRVAQPKLQEIQSRYKDDRQKLGVEMMACTAKRKLILRRLFSNVVQILQLIALFALEKL